MKGARGLNTSVLVSGSPLEGFSTEIWNFTKGKYPVPSWCADEPLLQHARSLIVTFPETSTASNFHGSAVLSGLDGATWSVNENSPYTIQGNQLSAPDPITAQITGQLNGVSGEYSRNLTLISNVPVPLAGDGTEENPYRISSAEDWLALADYIPAAKDNFTDRYLKVTADIDFKGKTFKPIFIATQSLQGILDGAGHTIRNISYQTVNSYEAAIGTIDVNGVVRNLKIHGAITTQVANTGGFSAKVYGTVENCENMVRVTATKGAGHSGFGYSYYTARYLNVANRAAITGANGQLAGISHNVQEGVRFENVVNYDTIRSTSTATSCANFGGLAATCNPATFINCHNEGEFVFNKPDGSNQVGGIIGNATSSASPRQPMILTGCYNLGDITANNIVAGLIGNIGNNNCVMELTDCYNRGNISSVATKSTSNSPTAGISAFFSVGSTIRGCRNYGTITSAKNVYSAGIAGQYKSNGLETRPTRFVDCHNEGAIAANGNQGGGIIGIGTSWLNVDSCSNSGAVTGGFGLGGIMGQFSSANSRITHCYNMGDITSSQCRVGGIVGWGNAEGLIEDCFNVGDIATTSEAKGTATTSGYQIGGIAGYSGSTVRRCYNIGSVAGASQVGGLLGGVFKNRTRLYDCYNAGEVIADIDTCGSLIGMNLHNGANWNTGNVIQNCYYLKPEQKFVNDVLGTEMTVREMTNLDMGNGWINGDKFSLPVLSVMDNEIARLYSACIILEGADTYNSVTRSFNVGRPEGVVWTANIPNVIFEGTRARFTRDGYIGPLVLTAAAGEHHRTFNLKASWPGSAEMLDGDAIVVSEQWFTADGIRINVPAPGKKGVYVVVRTYDNGMRRSEKVNIR